MEKRKWGLRRGNLFLFPGDSPVGYRLPLPSLPFVGSDYPFIVDQDSIQERGRLPDYQEIMQHFEHAESVAGAVPVRKAGTHRAGSGRRRGATRFPSSRAMVFFFLRRSRR